LAVYPDEAQKLVMAQELGALTLTLRSLWEKEKALDLEHATIHNTLGIPQRVRTRTRARWEVIRTGGF
jgi:Flp pilus assembly protein CpaB